MQTIFICGAQNEYQAADAAGRLVGRGHRVVNPWHELKKARQGGATDEYLARQSILLLVRDATAVALCKDWVSDEVARAQHTVAVALRLPVGTLVDWSGGDAPRPPAAVRDAPDVPIEYTPVSSPTGLRRKCPQCGVNMILPDMEDCGCLPGQWS